VSYILAQRVARTVHAPEQISSVRPSVPPAASKQTLIVAAASDCSGYVRESGGEWKRVNGTGRRDRGGEVGAGRRMVECTSLTAHVPKTN